MSWNISSIKIKILFQTGKLDHRTHSKARYHSSQNFKAYWIDQSNLLSLFDAVFWGHFLHFQFIFVQSCDFAKLLHQSDWCHHDDYNKLRIERLWYRRGCCCSSFHHFSNKGRQKGFDLHLQSYQCIDGCGIEWAGEFGRFFLRLSVSNFLCPQLMLFTQQITSTRLEFSCGLFNFDWALCLKVKLKKDFFHLCNIFIHFSVPVHQCKRHVCGDFNSIWNNNAEK